MISSSGQLAMSSMTSKHHWDSLFESKPENYMCGDCEMKGAGVTT